MGKYTIREGVWETNSSSVHAIAISKKKINLDDIRPFGRTLRFNHGEFGWEHRIYDNPYSKASYLYQAIWDVYSPSYTKTSNKSADRDKAINWLYDTLSKYGIEVSFDPIDYGDDDWCIGYIDHGEGMKDWVEQIIGHEKRLIKYLFGDSAVCTSNDNCDMEDLEEFMKDHPKKDYEVYMKGN